MKAKKSGGLGSMVGIIAAFLILCVILAIASDKFVSYSNFMSILKQTPFNALLAIGMLFCLITAGIDLSVGANATFCACLMGMLVQKGVTNSLILIIAGLAAGTVIGLINGTLLTRLHLPHPFVSTLGMKNFLWGAALLVTGSQMIGGFPKGVMALGSATVGGFPVSFIVVVILYIVLHIVLTRTAFGRSVYCAGGEYGGHTSLRYQLSKCADSLLCAFWLYGCTCRELSPLDVPVSVTVRTPSSHTIPMPLPPVYSAEHLSWAEKVR